MLDQLDPPAAEPGDVGDDLLAHLRHGRVERPAIARQSPGCRARLGAPGAAGSRCPASGRRSAGPLASEPGHVGELLIAAIPVAGSRPGPAPRPGCQPSSITANGRLALVGESSTTRLAHQRACWRRCSSRRPSTSRCCRRPAARQERPGAHLAAEGVDGGERRFAAASGRLTTSHTLECAIAELDGHAAAADVGPEARCRAGSTCQKQSAAAPGAHAVAVGDARRRRSRRTRASRDRGRSRATRGRRSRAPTRRPGSAASDRVVRASEVPRARPTATAPTVRSEARQAPRPCGR